VDARQLADTARMHARSRAIPRAALIAACSFGGRLTAERVTAAAARGLREGGHELIDPCPLDGAEHGRGRALNDLLVAVAFDTRMRHARALVIAEPCLRRPTLERSAAFELATRARQAGVPCYALTARNELNAFDARMLDLQLILEASDARGLAAAARELARVL
jgi:glycerate kinase